MDVFGREFVHYRFNDIVLLGVFSTFDKNTPIGDRDHEVLGMGSFGEYTQLYGN
jgi:hypothetical protein